jgi:hypothetical protein
MREFSHLKRDLRPLSKNHPIAAHNMRPELEPTQTGAGRTPSCYISPVVLGACYASLQSSPNKPPVAKFVDSTLKTTSIAAKTLVNTLETALLCFRTPLPDRNPALNSAKARLNSAKTRLNSAKAHLNRVNSSVICASSRLLYGRSGENRLGASVGQPDENGFFAGSVIPTGVIWRDAVAPNNGVEESFLRPCTP